MLIESLCGTMEAVVCLGHGGVPRSEIPEQSKRAGSLRTGLTTAVKIQTRFNRLLTENTIRRCQIFAASGLSDLRTQNAATANSRGDEAFLSFDLHEEFQSFSPLFRPH